MYASLFFLATFATLGALIWAGIELLRTMVESYGQTTVMVTHDPQAAAIAHRILFLSDGLIVRDMGPSGASDVIAAMDELSRR